MPRAASIDARLPAAEAILREAIAAGAMAYVPKALDRASSAEALRHVLAGETWQPEDGEGTASPTGATVAERMKALTPQQHNILGLIVAGKPNKIIAYELDIAETTVKAHVTLILRKLGVFSRTQAVLAARDFFEATCGSSILDRRDLS